MPLFATFIGSISSALVAFFARFFSISIALKLAAYTTWLAVFSVFLTTVLACLVSLHGMATGFFGGGGGGGGASGWITYFAMGAGMFIPSNAGAVMSCVGSVWIATSVWKIQKIGLENFSK